MPQSITEKIEEIHDAWRAANKPSPQEAVDNYSWIVEVFDTEVIIEDGGKYFKVSYSTNQNDPPGDIVFAPREEWQEVEKETEWVEKSAMIQVQLTGKNSLKSLGVEGDEMLVGNYIILFGDSKNRDLTKEWFTKETQVESPYTKSGVLYVDWEHGQSKDVMGVGPDKDDILGTVRWKTAKVDDQGIWVQRVLDLRNKYMEYIQPLIEAGMVGTSSQAVGKGIQKTPQGMIKAWPLERDTLTVVPAEPRMMGENVISAIKSLAVDFPELKAYLPKGSGDDPGAGAGQGDKSVKPILPIFVEDKNMKSELKEFLAAFAESKGMKFEDLSESEIAALSFSHERSQAPTAEDPNPGQEGAIKHLQEQVDSISKNMDELMRYAKETPAIDNAGYISRDGEDADPQLKSLGDFLVSVARGDEVRLKTVYKSVFNADRGEKADMSLTDGGAGGYMVPQEYESNLLKLAENVAPVSRMCTPVPVAVNRGSYPILDQYTAPTAGQGDVAWAGGITATPKGENTTLDETSPLFKLLQWNITKVGGFVDVPNELVADSPQSIEAMLEALFAIAIAAKREYFVLNGTGANEPLGVLNSAALIAVTTTTNDTFALADCMKMLAQFKPYLSQGAWFMHNSVIPDLSAFEAGTGGSVWLTDQQNDAVIGKPILGKPNYVSEHLPQANSSGDVILADMKAYLLFERQGLQVAYSEHAAFKTDQAVWRFTQRMDGMPWVKGASTLGGPGSAYTVSPFLKHHD
jgi:HK97 family phage major capsid protein